MSRELVRLAAGPGVNLPIGRSVRGDAVDVGEKVRQHRIGRLDLRPLPQVVGEHAGPRDASAILVQGLAS